MIYRQFICLTICADTYGVLPCERLATTKKGRSLTGTASRHPREEGSYFTDRIGRTKNEPAKTKTIAAMNSTR